MLGPEVPPCRGSLGALNARENGDRQDRLLRGLGLAMTRNLILSGGVAHDYARTSPMLAEVLAEVGVASEIHEDFGAVEDGSLLEYDLLTLNCVRWTCSQPEVNPAWRDEWRFELSREAREGFLAYFEAGKGLLALHCATICFDDWPEYREILGAWWEWGQSGHAPYQEHRMRVRTDAHPITDGIGDFAIVDELYTNPAIADPVSPLIEAEWGNMDHPILRVRRYGGARVCYNALGHGPEAFEHPANQTLLRRGALWVLGEIGEGESGVL